MIQSILFHNSHKHLKPLHCGQQIDTVEYLDSHFTFLYASPLENVFIRLLIFVLGFIQFCSILFTSYSLYVSSIILVLVLVLLHERPIIFILVFVSADENNTVGNRLYRIRWCIKSLMHGSASFDRWSGKRLTPKGCKDYTTRLIFRTRRVPRGHQSQTSRAGPNTGCSKI